MPQPANLHELVLYVIKLFYELLHGGICMTFQATCSQAGNALLLVVVSNVDIGYGTSLAAALHITKTGLSMLSLSIWVMANYNCSLLSLCGTVKCMYLCLMRLIHELRLLWSSLYQNYQQRAAAQDAFLQLGAAGCCIASL